MAQLVKDLPPMQEIRVLSLGQENPLEKGMATCSSFHVMDRGVWIILWIEEPVVWAVVHEVEELDTTE